MLSLNNNPRVLVAHEDPATAEQTSAALRSCGLATFEVTSTASIVEEFEDRSFRLVLVSVTMPEFHLQQLTKVLRDGSKPAVKVILLGADCDAALLESGLQQGADDFLLCPIRKTDALLTIRRLLRAPSPPLDKSPKEVRRDQDTPEIAQRPTTHRVESLLRSALDGGMQNLVLLDQHLHIIDGDRKTFDFIQEVHKVDNPIGESILRFIAPEQHALFQEAYQRALAGSEQEQEVEVQLPNETRWFKILLRPLVEDSGAIKGVVYSTLDITTRVHAEKALEESEKELRQLNHAKDTLLHVIAHDLRNVFTGILGVCELMRTCTRAGRAFELDGMVDMVLDSTKQAVNLLNNLLGWARIQCGALHPNPTVWPVSTLVDSALDSLAPIAASKDLALETQMEDELEVEADYEMVATILRNLLTNAIKFTRQRGRISVRTSRIPNGVEVAVSDTGLGIPEAVLERILCQDEHISTLGTANEGGTGLGLSICRQFAEAIGGKLRVESEPGRGSTFCFTLPTKH
jgi:signal transduction histidine kinase/FixJ family two-component response regulator